MTDFHNTGYGRTFFNSQLPELIRNLGRIANCMEKEQERQTPVEEASKVPCPLQPTVMLVKTKSRTPLSGWALVFSTGPMTNTTVSGCDSTSRMPLVRRSKTGCGSETLSPPMSLSSSLISSSMPNAMLFCEREVGAMTEQRTVDKIIARVAEIKRRNLGHYIGEGPTSEKRAEILKRVKELLEEALERSPKLIPFGIPVLPVEGLPSDIVACVKLRDDGEFDISYEFDPEQSDVNIRVKLELVQVRLEERRESE